MTEFLADRFFNREFSWLRFNERVLEQAQEPTTPLLERVKFLQIFTTNLDEFFMKRVGGYKHQAAVGIEAIDRLRPAPSDMLRQIRAQLEPLLKVQADLWENALRPELEAKGVHLLAWDELYAEEQESLARYFDQKLFHVLTPLAVDPGHPFPFISNLSTSLGVTLRHPGADPVFARIKIPGNFPSWVELKSGIGSGSGEFRLIRLSDVVVRFLDRLFPGMEILDTVKFRITRNADIERDEEDAEDLLEMMAQELKERRFASVVRLEHSKCKDPSIIEFLKQELELEEGDVYEQDVDVDFAALQPLWSLPIRDLKFRPYTPALPKELCDPDSILFEVIRRQDILVHHPYESFSGSVERFISTAAQDPAVLAIKMVLYRTGADSPFIPLLIQAAEAGKQVVCLVELKARFDEERNIQVAKLLEKAGVHVLYGMVGVKTHCKVSLVVRQEGLQGQDVRTYAHIGTGNYNANTAKLYTDFGLLTADPAITSDVTRLFHFLTGRSLHRDYGSLLVAPVGMKSKFLELIDFEIAEARAGRPAAIVAKMNSLEDREIIEALYRASSAGVGIDLVVRGFCCLRPGVPGMSENIRVTSVIGRFLEHSRVYHFRHGADRPKDGVFYVGSADWMQRNLDWRVEAITPIRDGSLRAKLWTVLRMTLADRAQTWDLSSTGDYTHRVPVGVEGSSDPGKSPFVGVQEKLLRAYRNDHLTALTDLARDQQSGAGGGQLEFSERQN